MKEESKHTFVLGTYAIYWVIRKLCHIDINTNLMSVGHVQVLASSDTYTISIEEIYFTRSNRLVHPIPRQTQPLNNKCEERREREEKIKEALVANERV